MNRAQEEALDLAEFFRFTERHQKLILSAHETPDADAVGSEYALLKGLQQMGKTALVFNADPAPKKFTFMDSDREIVTLTGPELLPSDLEEYAFILLDVNDTNNIGNVAELVLARAQEMLIIDHHESEEDIVGPNLMSRSASSTCEIIYQILRMAGVRITFEMAQALFMGIVFDTGSFIYPKTTALTFEIARDLVRMGVEPYSIYSKLYESNSVGALLLQAQVGATLELVMDNHVAIQTMRKEMIVSCEARYEDADQVINNPLKSEDIRVSIFFKENLEGVMRCSLRSKGNIDVAEIAQSNGGGGHRTAAGFKCTKPMEVVKAEILSRLEKYFA